jgi:hypothetical protein
MKIAIYEPRLRVAGPVGWAFHLRDGFRELGHECDVVTVTRSGDPSIAWGKGTGEAVYKGKGPQRGWGWWPRVPDRVLKLKDAKEGFQDYNLIVLTEPKSAPYDRYAQKQRGKIGRFGEKYIKPDALPMYLEVLRDARVPWTSALHGPQYDRARAPFIQELLGLDTFTGVLLTPQAGFFNERLGDVKVIEHRGLPYTAIRDIDAKYPTQKIFGMTGRCVGNKGQQLLAALADELKPGWNVDLYGAGAVGLGPCFTYRLLQALRTIGAEGELEGGDTDPKTGKRRALKPERWKAKTEGGRVVRYRGNYEDAIATAGKFAVHLLLTDKEFSYGEIEFAGLEALDAGCVPVYPSHSLGAAPYEVFELEKFVIPPPVRANNAEKTDYVAMDAMDPDVIKEVLEKTTEAAEFVEADGPERIEQVRHNRELLLSHHDPKIMAQRFLDEVTPLKKIPPAPIVVPVIVDEKPEVQPKPKRREKDVDISEDVVPAVLPVITPVGWICPVCGRGNAPWLPTCSCKEEV